MESPDGYLLLDEEGKVVKNLTAELEYVIHEEPIIYMDEGYIEAVYSDNFSGEYRCLFSMNGCLIKKGLTEIYKYIPNRDEFIVIANENGDSEVLEYKRGGDDYLGVIDSSGSYVIGPEFTNEIIYSPMFDIYVCDRNIYYDSEFIGFLADNKDISFNEQNDINIIKFQHEKKFGLLSTEGIILSAEYDSISEIEDSDFRILTRGLKKAIYNVKSQIKSDFIFDFVSNYLDIGENENSFITKINGLYGMYSIDDTGQFVEKLSAEYDNILEIEDSDFRILTKGGKKAIYNIESQVKSDLIFDFVSNYLVGRENENSFITRKDELYGRYSIDETGKFVEILPHVFINMKRITLVGQDIGYILQHSQSNDFFVFDRWFYRLPIYTSKNEEEALQCFISLIEIKSV